jgi:exosortase
MSQTADTVTLAITSTHRPRLLDFVQPALLVVLIALLYHGVLAALVADWWTDPNDSHGFIVPIFCAWVIWKERKRLADTPRRPSWYGILVITGALGLLVLGTLGAELYLSRTSLLFLLAGLAIQFRGWRFFQSMLFPWAVLFLMVPLPAIISNQITLPLQFQASRLASGLLEMVGVPVLREGNVIQLPSLTLDVVEACSGLRSLVSLITLAVLYGYLFERRSWLRLLLVLVAAPIAVVANGVRIMGSGILGQYWSPDKAEGFFHMFTGWLIFVISFSLMMIFHGALSWFARKRKPRQV